MVDVDIWHKRIGHVNEQRLRGMRSKQIVAGLPKFKVDGMHKVCATFASLESKKKAHFCMSKMYVRSHWK